MQGTPPTTPIKGPSSFILFFDGYAIATQIIGVYVCAKSNLIYMFAIP